MSIWRVKPVSAFEADMKKSELKRVLGNWSLTASGIGAIIGGGIFVLTGTGAYYHADPALALSFIKLSKKNLISNQFNRLSSFIKRSNKAFLCGKKKNYESKTTNRIITET